MLRSASPRIVVFVLVVVSIVIFVIVIVPLRFTILIYIRFQVFSIVHQFVLLIVRAGIRPFVN
ncbi:hypothetical protein M7I_2862 [Glarea lozoyensis 74030]|uniref:Uncharacterized protein n=1 Tax=Glarea lozoyensis (strain ATCC 74030 / MF5533) TaxID=1104152 RepID=H0EJX8_GLAL7|nr:hypothetical protein M7I_2862 [Glarea lozoyensis 74030]